MTKNNTKAIVLSGVTFEDVAHALEFTDLSISRTIDPHVYVITPVVPKLPRTDSGRLSAFLRRQAD